MNVIEFDHVTKIYTRSHLGKTTKNIGLSALSLTIKKGEVFGLLGLNGSGKTTAIKLLLGLLKPTEGKVVVQGNVMPNQEALKKVGYLPEAAYINKYLTGREAIGLFATLSDIPKAQLKEKVEDIIDKVGLTKAAHRRVSDYSKGMMQRVSMAQALIHDPDILVMDEPVTGLDPLAIQELRQLIVWLKEQGKTVFFSSHNISEVERVCDRIAILAAGQLAIEMSQAEWVKEHGKLETLFTQMVQRSDQIGPLKIVGGTK